MQLKLNLEEENRHLLEQISRLMSQNEELLSQTLESKDQIYTEQKQYTERMQEIRRQKEKLEEKIMDIYRTPGHSPSKRKGFGATIRKTFKNLSKGSDKPRRDQLSVPKQSGDTTNHMSSKSSDGGHDEPDNALKRQGSSSIDSGSWAGDNESTASFERSKSQGDLAGSNSDLSATPILRQQRQSSFNTTASSLNTTPATNNTSAPQPLPRSITINNDGRNMLQHSRDMEKLQNRVSTPNFIRSRPSSYYQSTPASSVGRASPSLSAADTSADRLQSLVSPKLAVVEPRRSTMGNSPHLLTANNRSSYYSAVDNPASRSLLDDSAVQLPFNSPEHMFHTPPSRDRPASSRTKPIRVDVPPPTERPASSMGTFTRRDVPPDVVKSPPANTASRSRPPPQTNGGSGGTREEEWYEYGCV